MACQRNCAVVSRMRGRVGRRFVSFAEGMTMTGRVWAMASAGVLLLTGTQAARADGDTYRLGGTGEGATTRLTWDGQAETTLTRGYRGGFGHGGSHRGYGGFYGGHHVGHYGGFYGGYRSSFY